MNLGKEVNRSWGKRIRWNQVAYGLIGVLLVSEVFMLLLSNSARGEDNVTLGDNGTMVDNSSTINSTLDNSTIGLAGDNRSLIALDNSNFSKLFHSISEGKFLNERFLLKDSKNMVKVYFHYIVYSEERWVNIKLGGA